MKNWYIVQSYSNFEKKVADLIKKEAIKAKLEDKIEEVLENCNKHWWEPAARHYLSEGGHLDDCYPLPERRYTEAAAWQRANDHYVPDDIG